MPMTIKVVHSLCHLILISWSLPMEKELPLVQKMSHLAKDSLTVPAVGQQHSSMKPTNPSFSFASAKREEISKLYISKEHDKLTPSRWSPGAIYQVNSSINHDTAYSFGRAPRSNSRPLRAAEDLTFATADSQVFKFPAFASVLFGTDSRDNLKNAVILQNHPQAFFGKHSPGPQAYRVSQPPKEVVPSITFGHKTKILASDSQTPINVGPGSYPVPPSVGPQFESTKSSHPTFRFGRAARSPTRRVSQPVTNVEGGVPSIGRQFSSKLLNSSQVVFGSSTRDHAAKTALTLTPLDKGGSSAGPIRLPHPVLPLERDIVRYS